MFHVPLPIHPPPGLSLPPYVWRKALFAPVELDRIAALAAARPASSAAESMRRGKWPAAASSLVRTLPPAAETVWLYQRLLPALADLNAEHFQFDAEGMDEPPRHIAYAAADGGHHDWHTDLSPPGQPARKLSFILQLSDPADYDGGTLEMNAFGVVDDCPRERGMLIVFPSHHLHRVTPLTRGRRDSLVGWLVGPPLR